MSPAGLNQEVSAMASLEKNAGFLRGLLEGMELDMNSPNGKLLSGIVDLLAELSDRTEAIDEMLGELNEYVEDIDDDLARLEGVEGAGDEDSDDDFSFLDDDDFEDGAFGAEDQLHLLTADETGNDADGDALEGGICPECGGISFIARGGRLSGLYICPHCKKKVGLKPLSEENTPIAAPADGDGKK